MGFDGSVFGQDVRAGVSSTWARNFFLFILWAMQVRGSDLDLDTSEVPRYLGGAWEDSLVLAGV